MQIRFWGTRGSIAKPGPTTLRYGGNTSCVEVRTAEGTIFVVDCGTGAHGLGQALLASGIRPLRGHLLISHTHWDHIQGFPFFTPLFIRGNEWDVYAPRGLNQRLEEVLAGQMEYTYFPVTLDQLAATIRYHDLVEGTFEAGGVRIVTRYLNHPALTLGYRLEVGGVTMVYAADHEPHSRHQPDPAHLAADAPARLVHREDQRHVEFLAGADLVIHDTQYTEAEYGKKVTWGHSPAEWAVDFAAAAGVKRLALFHHDALRDDEALDRLVEVCRRRAGSALDVFAAAEGMVVDLPERGPTAGTASRAFSAVVGARDAETEALTVLIVDDDRDIVRLLTTTLKPEGLRLLTAFDGESALALARSQRPDLILLDLLMPELDGLAVCRALRNEADASVRDVPIVLLTALDAMEDTAAGFAAGATDYLTKPFSPAYVRTRVRGWLLRAHAGATSEGRDG
ncbi:MAG: response regulator [Chloroflexi bacterium]|nr:response regulator [Chloroflexota bacterium]